VITPSFFTDESNSLFITSHLVAAAIPNTRINNKIRHKLIFSQPAAIYPNINQLEHLHRPVLKLPEFNKF